MAKVEKKGEEKKLPAGITQEQLDAWKKEFGEGNVKAIQVDENGDGKSFKHVVVRKPDMEIVAKASKFSHVPFQAGMILYMECKLAADPEIEASDELKASACMQLVKLFKIREATILDL